MTWTRRPPICLSVIAIHSTFKGNRYEYRINDDVLSYLHGTSYIHYIVFIVFHAASVIQTLTVFICDCHIFLITVIFVRAYNYI
jgi:hypothetical protein